MEVSLHADNHGMLKATLLLLALNDINEEAQLNGLKRNVLLQVLIHSQKQKRRRPLTYCKDGDAHPELLTGPQAWRC